MADNISILDGAGSTVTLKTKDASGIQVNQSIPTAADGTVAWGTAGTSNANVMTVQGIASGTAMPISVASIPSHAVTNAGTFAVQAAEADGANVTLGAKADAKSTATDTTAVTAMSVLKQISASVQAPPSQAVTNAGTFAVQATLGAETTKVIGVVRTADGSGNLLTSTSNALDINIKSGNPTTITATQGTGSNLHTVVDSGTVTTVSTVTNLSQFGAAAINLGTGTTGTGTLRVVLATDQPALTNKLLVTPDSVALPANQSVNISQINAHTALEGGTNGALAVGGANATNVAITTNPINNGAQGVSSENSVVTTGRMVQLVADLVGKLIVLPYANPENFVSGAITSAMTGTTTTSLIAAPAAGLRNYITQITVSNSHATVGTDIIIQDGSGGTTLYTIPAAAVYGGAVVVFPTPLRQPTTATAIFCANVTTGASTKVSASGYKGV